ncbi:MAG: hypothetical protein AAF711_09305 [Planctomycetota bacterium]
MRLVLFLVLVLLSGCSKAQRVDRAALDQRYQATQLVEGVLSVIPQRVMADVEPPVIVNWWYTGSSQEDHRLVFRRLTWDQDLVPVGIEENYLIAQTDLPIQQRFMITRDPTRWVPLYEAAPNEIEPPADLPTARKAPNPITNDPIQRPEEFAPSTID